MAKKKEISALGHEVAELQKPLGVKRLASWLFFAPLLLAFLVIPIYAWKTSNEVSTQADASVSRAQTHLFLDAAWNPGPVASSHAPWENDCQACHDGAFTRVQDNKCTACHGNMGEHVVLEEASTIQFEEGRCASCHRDHKGRESLMVQNAHFSGSECGDCHKNIKASAPDTNTLPVADFAGTGHPEFRVTVWDQPQNAQLIRLRLNKEIALKEPTSLKFPHDVHMDAKGIDGPREKVVMKCDSCHEPANTETGFKPLQMEAHCQDCHSLAFEPALPDRQLPHGDPQHALDTLVEFYSFLSQNPKLQKQVAAGRETFTQRPGKADREQRSFGSMRLSATAQANFAAKEVFEKSACAVCHEVTKLDNPQTVKNSPGKLITQYSVAVPNQPHPWMPMARFDHKAHEFESCGTCHKAIKSEEASDVLMPGIAVCQDCHSGSKPEAEKVQSECSVCHGYHIHTEVNNSNEKEQPEVATLSKP